MLSIAKLGHGRVDYYLDTVAKGIEDYYAGSGEAPGTWRGGAVEGLGTGRRRRRRHPARHPRRPPPRPRHPAGRAGAAAGRRVGI